MGPRSLDKLLLRQAIKDKTEDYLIPHGCFGRVVVMEIVLRQVSSARSSTLVSILKMRIKTRPLGDFRSVTSVLRSERRREEMYEYGPIMRV